MPDPIEELENFNQQGLHVNPLPASEVRRRGDRMRRRNTALATVGAGAAAVVLIATPLAVANHDSTSSRPLSPSSQGTDGTASAAPTPWLQAIPPGFDLGALPADASFEFDTSDGSVVDDVTLCGVPVFSTTSNDPVGPAIDTEGATYGEPGTESMAGRTLALYRDDADAHAALEALRTGVENCPEDPNGRGATLVNRFEDSPLPADESFVYSQRSRMDADLFADLYVIQVARVGNAVYISADGGGPGDEQAVAAAVQRAATLSAPVLSDLDATFSEAAVTGGGQDGSIGEGAVSAIPPDFPLLAGLPTDADAVNADFGRHGPEVDGQRMELLACDRGPLDDTGKVERMVGGWRDVDESRERQLSTFATQADAQTYAGSVVDLLTACPEQVLGDGVVRPTTSEPGQLGDYAVTTLRRDTVDGEPGVGAVVTQVLRLGRAVLVSQVVSESSSDPAPDQVAGVVEAMCTWTTEGC
jgi:hypothetical protein